MSSDSRRNPMKHDWVSQEDRRRFLKAACLAGPLVSLAATGPCRGQSSFLTTEDRVAVALMNFNLGFHCVQSVFEVYAEDYGIDPKLARRLVAGLAGGSTVGGECGVVSAAYLVLGLGFARAVPAHGDTDREAELFDRIREFVSRFRARHGSINCRELLGIDVFSPEGRAEGLERNLFATRCPLFIEDGIKILEDVSRSG